MMSGWVHGVVDVRPSADVAEWRRLGKFPWIRDGASLLLVDHDQLSGLASGGISHVFWFFGGRHEKGYRRFGDRSQCSDLVIDGFCRLPQDQGLRLHGVASLSLELPRPLHRQIRPGILDDLQTPRPQGSLRDSERIERHRLASDQRFQRDDQGPEQIGYSAGARQAQHRPGCRPCSTVAGQTLGAPSYSLRAFCS
jgi:hypothetical protein